MAAVEEEDSPSQNKKDDIFFNSKRKQFNTMQQDFENKLLRMGATYEHQVGTILSGWDHLTGSSSVAQLPFASFLYSWTLKLVLQGEWPKLEKIVKTRLGATLQRCARDPLLEPKCKKLLPLVTDPWGHFTLKAIVAGSQVTAEEVKRYIELESWEVIRVRIETMLASRCEELALSLLKAVIRFIDQPSENSTDPALRCTQDHNHFVDLFFVLLYKFHRKQFFEKVKELNVEDGVYLVRRLVAQQDQAKVWKHRLKIAEITIQIVLASCAVKPYNDIFRLVFSEWCSVMKTISAGTDELISMTRKYIQLTESSRHIYSMASLLHHEFGDSCAALVTELIIGALTRDLNSLERVKWNTENADARREEQIQIEQQMATGFMYLSSVFAKYETVARECVLTAFSLHPTIERFAIIKRFASNSTTASKSSPPVDIKTEPSSFSPFHPFANVDAPIKAENSNFDSTTIPRSKNCHNQNIVDDFEQTKLGSEEDCKPIFPNLFSVSEGTDEFKVKEEIDSMDGFLANTEGLIEQLHIGAHPKEFVKCDIFTTPQQLLNTEQLGISTELCDDLAVVLSSPRWQILSWLLDQTELLNICELYLRDSDTAKNITKELKFLNIDYEQFKHMSSDGDEFGGIEKGYEHFVELSSDESEVCDSQGKSGFSSSSEIEICKPRKVNVGRSGKRSRGRKKHVSDSDSTTNYRNTYGTTTTNTTSVSESEDTDLEYTTNKGIIIEKGFEGKRVTAVSNSDRRKRLRVDAITGRVRMSRNPQSLVNDLRLYRHMFQNEPYLKIKTNNYAPSLGTVNLSPSVVIKENYPNVKVEDDNHNKFAEGDREQVSCIPTITFGKIKKESIENSLKKGSRSLDSCIERKPTNLLTGSQNKPSIWGNLLPKVNNMDPPRSNKSPLPSVTFDRKVQSTKFQESYTKFLIKNQFRLIQDDKKRKKEKLQLHVNGKKTGKDFLGSRSELSVSEKGILNRLMQHDPKHRIAAQVNTIAMPVSHNPPNLPPNKGPPTGLSRSLPKGTTVVRRSRTDGAGPSGLNNGGATVNVLSHTLTHTSTSLTRPTLSITPNFASQVDSFPSVSTISRATVVRSQANTNIDSNINFQNEVNSSPPLAPATVAVAITPTSQSCNIVATSPGEIQSGFSSRSSDIRSSVSFLATPTTSSTVASSLGEPRSTSMLESLLRDQSVSHIHSFSSSNRESPSGCATSFCESILASSVCTSVTSNLATDVYSPISTTSRSSMVSSMLGGNDSRSSSVDETGAPTAQSSFSIDSPTSLGSSTVFATASTSRSLPIVSRGRDSERATNLGTATVTPTTQGCLSQYLLPAQLIQVQVSDGSTSLGLVPSNPLDFRLPPGTRVIKPNNAVASGSTIPINQSCARTSNVLHNVKIVQNRPVVRTVLVPHSVALQSLGTHQTAQIVSLNQGSITASDGDNPQQHTAKIQSTQLQKLLGHNIVPGSLVIRAVRPSSVSSDVSDSSVSGNSELISKCDSQDKVCQVKQTSTDVLSDSLRGHCIKTTPLATSTTQNVGTQTQTTAVKSATGHIVSQGLMNSIRTSSHSTGMSSMPVVSHVESSAQPSSSGLNPLNLTSNAVSSEALKQLREFESVFEKVSNKSVKESDVDCCSQTFPATISSEESMIAAQLLNMANEPAISSNQNFSSENSEHPEVSVAITGTSTSNVSIPVTATITSPTASLGDGAFITSQTGTLILVNPSVSGSGIVTLSGSGQTNQPPPTASPALSSTSSQCSVASSASSTSSKDQKHSSTPKVITPSSTPPSKPKSPPPPKVPPKPVIAKPQVEESDEIKAKIQSILDQYKQDLANNPLPQPAPRNRKNCPPPKSEGKSSSKKKGQIKKPDGVSTSSPGSIESHLPSVSSSPANLSASTAGEDSDSSVGGPSVTPNRFSQDDKPKVEEVSSPQVLQGVVLSNVKVDATTGLANFPSAISGGRVFQLIRHGNGKVTAITTQQPYNKAKLGLNQGGPPPNVTIQGRINVSDLMESHLASLITGGSGTVTAGSSIITKLVQAQNNSGLQQLILQDSSQQGEQIMQQVTVQPILQARQNLQSQSDTVQNIVTESSTQKLGKHTIQPLSPGTSVGISPDAETQNQIASPQSHSSSPSPFAVLDDESSNGSDQSQESTHSGRLPPFFTLTKQFMTPAQSRFRDKNADNFGSYKSTNSKSQSDKTVPKAGNDSSKSSMRSVYGGSSGVKGSLTSDTIEGMSPTSLSLESSPAILTMKSSAQCPYDLRSSNSLDSIKSSLSAEEEQIPPSPATLTKQLQNAYMSEAALSPLISQSQLSSNSSYPSPAAGPDLSSFSESHKDVHLSSGLGTERRFSIAGSSRSPNIVGCSNNLTGTNGLEPGSLACLSSPSGDVYLDQANVGLSLDNLALGESHSQSPSLSDLVPPVPLLTWSPRSAHSPSLNDALSTNMALESQNSEDSLCDSSTSFPALFSIEGDGASVSSSTSDEFNMSAGNNASSSSLSLISNSRHYQSHLLVSHRQDFTRDQDQTVSSTRIESNSDPICSMLSSDSKDDASTESSESDWKFKCKNKYDRKTTRFLSQRTNEGASTSSTLPKRPDLDDNTSNASDENFKNRRRSQRQIDHGQKKDNTAYNGFQKENSGTNSADGSSPSNLKIAKYNKLPQSGNAEGEIKNENFMESMKVEVKSSRVELKEEDLPLPRITRGSKRRSEGSTGPDEKKGKYSRGKKEMVKPEDDDKCEYEAQTSRLTRSRHISGTSDSSSNYSIDRMSTPGPIDSPMSSTNGGGPRRKKRGGSHDSSISSRDGSPLTILQNSYQEYGSPNVTLNTRRASSREQAKKTRCACCVDQQQGQTSSSHSSSSRKSIGKSRGGTGSSS